MEAHDASEDGTLLLGDGRRLGYARYGLSDFQPGRVITDWPADVAEAADLLRIGRFSVAGASGGGPFIDRMPDLAAALCQTVPPR